MLCRESLRLRPSSPMRPVVIGRLLLLLAGIVSGVLTLRLQRPVVNPSPDVASMPRSMDPAIKAAYDKAKQQYQAAHIRWLATPRNPRYDHAKSVELARDSRTLLDEVTLTDAAGYKTAADLYQRAATKLEDAITQANAEEEAGKTAEQAAMAELQQAQQDYDLCREATWTPSRRQIHRRPGSLPFQSSLADALHEADRSLPPGSRMPPPTRVRAASPPINSSPRRPNSTCRPWL